MREILFRGKNEADVWHYGAYLPYESGEVAILESFSKYGYEAVELSQRCKVIPETVGQYTGLTGKNGKKIFEGDIVTVIKSPCYTKYDSRNLVIRFDEYHRFIASGILEHPLIDSYEWEIIGNIYDNPELLKGGAE